MARKSRDVIVRFLSDVQGFLRGTDDVSDSLADVARDLDKTADKGEDSARDLARAFDRAGDKITRDSRKAAKDTSKAYADTGKEAGQEFVSNLGESVSSGDVSGLLSGTVGGLASSFGATGPIGAAFAGLAIVGATAFSSITAAAEKARESAQTAFDELIDSASKETRLRNRLEEYFGTYEEGFARITQYADTTGIPIQTIADALAEGGSKASDLAAEVETIRDRIARTPKGTYALTAIDLKRAESLADDLERTAAATERAAAAERARARALTDSASAAADFYRLNPLAGMPSYATGKR